MKVRSQQAQEAVRMCVCVCERCGGGGGSEEDRNHQKKKAQKAFENIQLLLSDSKLICHTLKPTMT